MAMLFRLALLTGLGVIFAGSIAAVRASVLRRQAHLQHQRARVLWRALGETPDIRPALVVFASPGCVACRTAQEPAVQVLSEQLGGALRVLHVDIRERPAAARAFKILTAPSTVILAPDGRVEAVNQGFAGVDVLRAQVSAAAGGRASQPSPRPPVAPAPAAPVPAFRR
jgi:thiol-disulfide isomerase/thioredoxin